MLPARTAAGWKSGRSEIQRPQGRLPEFFLASS
jgi:hypothetical protein